MPPERRRPKGAFRVIERWAIGFVFAVLAFVLERVVMRSVGPGGAKRREAERDPTVITAKGPDAEV